VRTHANVGAESGLERRPYRLSESSVEPVGGYPPGKAAVTEIGETLACSETECQRRAHSRGYCTTHYRRWRSGQPMNAPIRRYRRKRQRPFEAEWALLKELGLA
jgi:hypothetical protein